METKWADWQTRTVNTQPLTLGASIEDADWSNCIWAKGKCFFRPELFSSQILGLRPDYTRPYNPFPTILPSLLASLGTTLSLSSSVPSSPPPGQHCVFITIKESLPWLTIRPHYAVLCFVTLVTVWSVIWLLLMQDFRARALLGLAERDTNTHTHKQHSNTGSTIAEINRRRSDFLGSQILGEGGKEYGSVLCSYYWWVLITHSKHSVIVGALSLYSRTHLNHIFLPRLWKNVKAVPQDRLYNRRVIAELNGSNL